MSEALKPCPFCGGGGMQMCRSIFIDVYNFFHEKEWDCNIDNFQVKARTEAEAIEAWNRRAE